MLRTSDLDYDLPPGCIATLPAEPRDAARMLVVPRRADDLRDTRVAELPAFLRRGDLLVLNTTRVLPARLLGERADTHGRVEGLFLSEEQAQGVAPSPGTGEVVWRVMLRARRLHPGVVVRLHDHAARASGVTLTLLDKVDDEPGAWRVRVRAPDAPDLAAGSLLAQIGRTPLPPYILRARATAGQAVDDAFDRVRYQTLYAGEAPGSVAAPTAGLHLTPAVLGALRERGVALAEVVLHVGTGTFKSVETEYVEQHPMHAEWCFLGEPTADAIARTRAGGGRVVCVGTTAARTVETFAAGGVRPGSWHATRLLITPGYPWRWTDALLTNFHLPRSTLMAMVGSLLDRGVPRLRDVYARAIAGGYRFYSYGDAMLVTPEG